jgi:hypothetical protein
MLTIAFSKSTLSEKNVYKWYKLFTEGREDVRTKPILDDPARQQPMKTLKQWEKVIMENRRITISEVAEDAGISVSSCHAIFFGCVGHETCDSEVCSEIANFCQK